MTEVSLIRTPQSEVNATLEVLGKHGVTPAHLKKIRNNGEVAAQVAQMIMFGKKPEKQPLDTTEEIIRAIMGDNCFLLSDYLNHNELVEYFGRSALQKRMKLQISLTELIKAMLSPCPFSKNGQLIRNTHFLFVLPREMSIADWLEVYPSGSDLGFKPHVYNKITDGADEINANKNKTRFSVCLMHIGPVAGSLDKMLHQMRSVIHNSNGHEFPLASEFIPLHFFYYYKTGKYLNMTTSCRCREEELGRWSGAVGKFEGGKLSVSYHYTEHDCFDNLGAAAVLMIE